MENNSKNIIQYDFLTKNTTPYTQDEIKCVIPSGVDLSYISLDVSYTDKPAFPFEGNRYEIRDYHDVFYAVSNMFIGKFPLYSKYVKHTNTGTGYVMMDVLCRYTLFNQVDSEMYICLSCTLYKHSYPGDNMSDHECTRDLNSACCPKCLLLFKADAWTKMNTFDKFIRYSAIDNAVRHIDRSDPEHPKRTAYDKFQYICEFTQKFTGLQFPCAV